MSETRKEMYFKTLIKEYYNEQLIKEYEVLEEIETRKIIRDGLFREYDSNGYLSYEREYKLGVLNGSYKMYFLGELQSVGKFLNGQKEGKWLEGSQEKFYINGVLQEEPISNKEKMASINLNLIKYLSFVFIVIVVTLSLIIFFKTNNSRNQLSEKNKINEYIHPREKYDLIII
ncbi:MAG: hypothetical protein RR523_14830 [Cetobacterium sp.]|uniref:hypothetical protein n=1 Tax=Cetobacterium sp. TaxID=2071632 RepID=UPI002FC9AEB0